MKNQTQTLQDAMTEWLEVFKYPALQRTSYDRIEVTARAQIFPSIGTKQIDTITVGDLQNTLSAVSEKGLSYSTARKTYLLLSEFFRFLERSEQLEDNPMRFIEPIKKSVYLSARGRELHPLNETVTVFTEEEIERLREEAFLCYANGRQKHQQPGAYFLMLNTGLRRGELCGLLNSDIDWNERMLHVRRAVKEYKRRKGYAIIGGEDKHVGLPKTATSVRDIPLNNTAIEMIERLREERWFGNDSPLVPDQNGGFTKPVYLLRRFQRLQKSAGFTEIKGLHALRHTFATGLINGVVMPDGTRRCLSVKEVADLLGHTTTEITEQYYVRKDELGIMGLTDKFNL